ncbi:MAG: TonB-dependent receptor [Terricaulis sp.]
MLISGVGTAHATDGYFAHGIGTKAKGQAGAAIADPQDSLAIAANPASALELGNRWDAGLEVFRPTRSAVISGNGAGANGVYDGDGAATFYIPEIGYVRQLNDRLALGVAVYGNGGLNTDYNSGNPFGAYGATGEAGVNFEQLFISPTLAFRVAEGHSIGIAANIVYQAFSAKGLNAPPFLGSSSDPANFTNRGKDSAFGIGWRVGWLGHFTDRLSVGAFYQSRAETGDFDNYAGLFAESGGFDVPASYGAGVSFQATDNLNIAFDVREIEYSDVASVGNELGQLFLGNPFGADNGPGFGWEDTTTYKLGASYRLNDAWTVRGGYSTGSQPVPEDQTFLNILAPGVVQDQYTAGATWTLGSGLELSAYALYAPEETVEGSGSIPGPFGAGEADITLGETAFAISVGRAF